MIIVEVSAFIIIMLLSISSSYTFHITRVVAWSATKRTCRMWLLKKRINDLKVI